MHLMHAAAQRIIRRPGKGECTWGKILMKVKVATVITLDSLLIKPLFLFVTAEFSYISGKRSETALLFKLHISRIQSGAHMSEQVRSLWSSWPHSLQKTSCLRTRHHLSFPASKPSASGWCSSPSPHNTWSAAAFQHPSKPQVLPIFVGAGFQDLKLMLLMLPDSLYESHILFCYWILVQESYL